ncbi:MAG TPA: aminoacyl-tRNA hydrolase [Gemmatimonadaceae bacterium]|nr:aminoacyl-tRNA hydrolase [Gemmatimonadaceae bacterium]
MKVILGLGNPGRQYESTRHNVGWWVLDHLADVWHFEGWKRDGESLVSNGTIAGARARLIKPLTYMNLSGGVLRNYLRRPFWAPAKDLLVVVDDVALPVGRYRIRARGSAGGHNGLKSIEMAVGNQEYPRLRIGVGPSEERKNVYHDLADFVLAPFARDERDEIISLLPRVSAAIETWAREGADRAMNAHNRDGDGATAQ